VDEVLFLLPQLWYFYHQGLLQHSHGNTFIQHIIVTWPSITQRHLLP
jgi:hypothetical protein